MKEEIREQIEREIKHVLYKQGKNRICMSNIWGIDDYGRDALFAKDGISVSYVQELECLEFLGLSNDDYNYFFRKYGY